ncbi:MAG: hypothetical protein A2017_14580 [Lentisphaerae bacterium GWF2_44_16]|nr:MAG: hypothetical protein A2017_14580 [Lentisphaerae bacterium GWF2_44_16]
MSSNHKHNIDKHSKMELAIFNVGKIICALKSIEVQEIIKNQEITTVHHAPDYVRGVINLRGQIVTIISMRKKFKMNNQGKSASSEQQIVIVKMGEESVGLLVDTVDDILLADTDNVEPPPSNIRGVRGDYFNGIFKKDDALVAILNIHEILTVND